MFAILSSTPLTLAQPAQIAPSWTGLYNDEQKFLCLCSKKVMILNGYSVLNGKKLNFKGKIKQTDSNYTLTLNEVGQSVDVGRFHIEL